MPQARPDGKKILQQMSSETGGAFFEVSKKRTIQDIYTQLQEELRNQYSLGYNPDRKAADATFHKIHVAVRKKDLVVQARDGYYAR